MNQMVSPPNQVESFANINAPDDKRALEDKLARRDNADGGRMK